MACVLATIGYTNTDPTAMRSILRAILAADTDATCNAVRTAAGLAANDAVRALTQAYLRDYNLGRRTAAELQRSDSLICSVFRGMRLAQADSGLREVEIEEKNNGVLVLAAAAANLDDPVLAELLLRLEPGFTMSKGAGHEGALATSEFFKDFNAPRCAAWALREHPDGGLRHEEERALELMQTRLRKKAARWIRELGLRREADDDDDPIVGLQRLGLHHIRKTGEPIVLYSRPAHLFSFGNCLLGRPEFWCSVDDEAPLQCSRARLRGMLLDALCSNKPPEVDEHLRIDAASPLIRVLSPFGRLRAAGVPALLAVRV